MTEQNGWLDKVQKLLAMAEDEAATPAEAEAFSAAAERLMVKFSISDAMLAHHGVKVVDKATSIRIHTPSPYATVKRDLITSVAKAMGARAIHTSSLIGGVRKHEAIIVGFESDLSKIQMLLGSLLIQMSHAIVANPAPYRVNVRTYRTAVCVGFVHSVHMRLNEIRNAAVRESRNEHAGTDLALVDRSARVDSEVEMLFGGRLTRLANTNARNMAGYNTGRRAGDRADLGQPRMGGTTRVGINA
jgi:hypothetical protein